MDQFPPPEAYGRVTYPERYWSLRAEGQGLVERLTQDYLIERRDGLDVDEGLAHATTVESIVHLTPQRQDAASLTIAFTQFPGLLVRFGRWHIESYPRCGCDACDEGPSDLAEQLHARVNTLIAGGFSESLTARRWLSYEFVGRSGRFSGRRKLDRSEARRLGAPSLKIWSAWQPRR